MTTVLLQPPVCSARSVSKSLSCLCLHPLAEPWWLFRVVCPCCILCIVEILRTTLDGHVRALERFVFFTTPTAYITETIKFSEWKSVSFSFFPWIVIAQTCTRSPKFVPPCVHQNELSWRPRKEKQLFVNFFLVVRGGFLCFFFRFPTHRPTNLCHQKIKWKSLSISITLS
jgi:hypothetical protein